MTKRYTDTLEVGGLIQQNDVETNEMNEMSETMNEMNETTKRVNKGTAEVLVDTGGNTERIFRPKGGERLFPAQKGRYHTQPVLLTPNHEEDINRGRHRAKNKQTT